MFNFILLSDHQIIDFAMMVIVGSNRPLAL
jgi:hypothetical protein